METLRIEAIGAGPFVTVLTIAGPVEEGAEAELRRQLTKPELENRSVVVDLTEAILYDSWPFPLLAAEAAGLGKNGDRLVVSGDNPTVKPFVGDPSLPGLEWFDSLDDAMVELLGDISKLGEWPPADATAD